MNYAKGKTIMGGEKKWKRKSRRKRARRRRRWNHITGRHVRFRDAFAAPAERAAEIVNAFRQD